jgi:hypothetical protein
MAAIPPPLRTDDTRGRLQASSTTPERRLPMQMSVASLGVLIVQGEGQVLVDLSF